MNPSLAFARRQSRHASLLVVLSLLSACGGGGGADVVAPPAITGVALNSATVALQGIGATTSLSASLQPGNATGTISWRTDNASVVSVAGTGSTATITAVGGGTTTVTASAGGYNASATVVVTPLVRGITVSPTSASLLVGATRAVTATVSADAGANTRLLWSTSAAAVATVDSTGVITGVAPGSATVTATSAANSAVTATVTVAVNYPVVRSVSVSPANPAVLIGATRQLAATLDVDAGTSVAVTWSSVSPAVASVSTSGLVTGVAAGTAVIRATSVANPTVSGTTTVTVSAPTLRGIALSPTSASVVTGATQQIVPTVDADAGANTALTWTTSDAAVATVSGSGIVSAIAPGSAAIRATSVLVPAISASATITVTGPQVINAWSRRALTPFSPATSSDIKDAYLASANDGFAITSTDASDGTMLRWDGTAWNPMVLSPFGSLSAITGIPGRTFIGSDNGQIAEFATSSSANPGFVAMSTPAIGAVSRMLAMGSSQVVALVANSGSFSPYRGVLLLSGSTWTRLPDPPGMTALLSIDVGGPTNNILVSGIGGTGLSQWNGASWSTLPAPPLTGTLAHAAFVGADVVVISSNFTSARLSGGTWTAVTMPTPRPNAGGAFATRLITCGANVYAGTTFDGRMLRLNGNAWTVIADYGEATRGSYQVTPTCGATGTLRAVGTDGGIGRWSGSSWTVESSSPWLFDVSIVSPTLAYAAGGHGQVLRFDGTSWTVDATMSTFSYLQSLSASADGLVLAADIATPTGIWRKQNGTWQFDALPSAVSALWAGSTTFAIGLGATSSYVFNGSSWQAGAPISGFTVSRLDGASPGFVLAAGIAAGVGAIYRWDGSTWTRMTTPATNLAFTGLRVLSPTLAFATSGSTTYRWDGSTWTALPSAAAQIGSTPLRSVAALSATDVYALTATGRLIRFNGTTWNTQEIFPPNTSVAPLYTAVATINGLGLVVGYGGTIYVGRPGAVLRGSP